MPFFDLIMKAFLTWFYTFKGAESAVSLNGFSKFVTWLFQPHD